jgi:hypothetical protein
MVVFEEKSILPRPHRAASPSQGSRFNDDGTAERFRRGNSAGLSPLQHVLVRSEP